MGRNIKKGLDYFPLRVNMSDDVKLLEAKHGLEGFAILIKIYQKIYSEGYYIEWREENQLLFGNEVGIEIEKLQSIIDDCFRWGLLCGQIFEEYQILTSQGIQENYIDATKRRKKTEIKRDYCLIDEDNIPEQIKVVDKNQKDVNKNGIDESNYQQSKVKKSKVNISTSTCSESDSEPYSDEEIIEECSKMALKATDYLIEKINEENKRTPTPDHETKQFRDWVQALDRLHRLGAVGGDEGYEWQEIRDIIDWIFDVHSDDDFRWAEVIQSATGLREKIQKIEPQFRRWNDGGPNNSGQQGDTPSYDRGNREEAWERREQEKPESVDEMSFQ